MAASKRGHSINPSDPPHRHRVLAGYKEQHPSGNGATVDVQIVSNWGGTKWWRSRSRGVWRSGETESTSSRAVLDRWLAEVPVPRQVEVNPSRRVAGPGKIVGELVELGALTGLDAMAWSLRSAPVLAYDAKGRLFIVYAGRVVKPSSRSARRSYARTHWAQPGPGVCRDGNVPGPPFVALGPSSVIQYTTRKGSDRELVDYVHEWGEGGRGQFVPPTVVAHRCGDARCPWEGALALSGGSYRVEDRGIVG